MTIPEYQPPQSELSDDARKRIKRLNDSYHRFQNSCFEVARRQIIVELYKSFHDGTIRRNSNNDFEMIIAIIEGVNFDDLISE